MGERLETRDLLKLLLAALAGSSSYGFIESSGLLGDLAQNLGGSVPAAHLLISIGAGALLVLGW